MPSDRSTHDALHDERNDAIRIFLNGAVVPREQALVSVYDAGFMLGDGVWEGLRLRKGVWVYLHEHLDRLLEGAKAIDLDIAMSRQELVDALNTTAQVNDMHDGVHARLMVTRGVKSKPFQDPRLSKSGPTVAIIMEHSSADVSHGVSLFSVPQVRGLPHSQDPKLNSHSKLNCILAGIQAQKAGADEALMLDINGFVNTTNSCNFFIVRKGAVWTSTGDYCMNGITRQRVIDICVANQIPVFERNFSLADTYGADEAFITGTFGGQTPVVSIDGRDFQAGPVIARIQALYQQLLDTHVEVIKRATAE